MTQRALVIVDFQNDYFPGGNLPLVGPDAAVANGARVLAAARRRGDTVIHVQHQSLAPGATYLVPGTHGVEIHDAVRPAEGEPVVMKHFVNAFRDTELKATLEEHGVEEIVIVGAMSHMCIAAAGRAASDFGYRTTVLHDACATRDLEFEGSVIPAAEVHAANMAALALAYARVIATAEHLAAEPALSVA
ncbi:isochorismatase [Kaistia sp. 32K]|uniref:cysteine hydrolase family protein n=1 Tax=Kaistia sp. 32K TaxID=2795690 RepID=UPI001916801B|nr:cysteine hydrolase family protein [Kaistia sp. 32K]BCP53069.1 isochorismatase [Kaistia sp. 32K]